MPFVALWQIAFSHVLWTVQACPGFLKEHRWESKQNPGWSATGERDSIMTCSFLYATFIIKWKHILSLIKVLLSPLLMFNETFIRIRYNGPTFFLGFHHIYIWVDFGLRRSPAIIVVNPFTAAYRPNRNRLPFTSNMRPYLTEGGQQIPPSPPMSLTVTRSRALIDVIVRPYRFFFVFKDA